MKEIVEVEQKEEEQEEFHFCKNCQSPEKKLYQFNWCKKCLVNEFKPLLKLINNMRMMVLA